MPRATNAPASRLRRKRILAQAKGFRGKRHRLLSDARNAVDRANVQAYRGRKQKKRQYRALWTVRINVACRKLGLKYSDLIHGLKLANIALDRKILADLAATDAEAFAGIVQSAKAALAK